MTARANAVAMVVCAMRVVVGTRFVEVFVIAAHVDRVHWAKAIEKREGMIGGVTA